MKKALSVLLILSSFNFAQAKEPKIFTGDKALACEAILCLSTGARPKECRKAIKKFFSIFVPWKWHKTLKLRKNFLNLCPVGGENIEDLNLGNKDDEEFKKLINIIVNLKEDCSLENLNKPETKVVKESVRYLYDDNRWRTKEVENVYFRTNTKLTKSCKSLMSSKYTNIKPKYTCSDSSFYLGGYMNTHGKIIKNSNSDWVRGYKVTKENCIDHNTFKQLRIEEQKKYKPFKTSDFRFGYIKHCIVKTHKIDKDCWVFEK